MGLRLESPSHIVLESYIKFCYQIPKIRDLSRLLKLTVLFASLVIDLIVASKSQWNKFGHLNKTSNAFWDIYQCRGIPEQS